MCGWEGSGDDDWEVQTVVESQGSYLALVVSILPGGLHVLPILRTLQDDDRLLRIISHEP